MGLRGATQAGGEARPFPDRTKFGKLGPPYAETVGGQTMMAGKAGFVWAGVGFGWAVFLGGVWDKF